VGDALELLSALSHPADGPARLWRSSSGNGRLPNATIRQAMPSGHASRPQIRARREAHGAQTGVTLILLLVLLGLPAAAREPFPAPQGGVNDFAGVLDPSATAQLNALTAEVEQRTTAEVAVVVVHTTAPMTPKEYATALFNQWGVGKRGTDNGVMVLLAIRDRRVEIETGYGIEGLLPDGRVGEIIRTAMLPAFAGDRWGEGLVAGTQQVAQRLLEHMDPRQPPVGQRYGTVAARDVVYWIGWGYFVGWIGFLLVQRVRHHTLSSHALALSTVPGVGFLVWAFFPFILPFLVGLFLLVANVRARCPACGRWLSRNKRTVRTPTRDKLRETVYDCFACGYHDTQLALPGHSAWFGSSGPGSHGWSGGPGANGVSSSGVSSYDGGSSGDGAGGGGAFGGGASGGGGAGGSF
jgi:uncharacterized membrane protein YgcG